MTEPWTPADMATIDADPANRRMRARIDAATERRRRSLRSRYWFAAAERDRVFARMERITAELMALDADPER